MDYEILADGVQVLRMAVEGAMFYAAFFWCAELAWLSMGQSEDEGDENVNKRQNIISVETGV